MTMTCPNSNRSGLKSFSPWVFVTYGCSCRCEYCMIPEMKCAEKTMSPGTFRRMLEVTEGLFEKGVYDHAHFRLGGEPFLAFYNTVVGTGRGGCRATHESEGINCAVCQIRRDILSKLAGGYYTNNCQNSGQARNCACLREHHDEGSIKDCRNVKETKARIEMNNRAVHKGLVDKY
jgi:organic radical activating enzyme